MIDSEQGRNDRSPRDAEASRRSQASAEARQRLILAMIDNNARQLRFESARAGADIEQAGALRDMARDPNDRDAALRFEEVKRRTRSSRRIMVVSSRSGSGSTDR